MPIAVEAVPLDVYNKWVVAKGGKVAGAAESAAASAAANASAPADANTAAPADNMTAPDNAAAGNSTGQ
jgi:cytochrome c oxidase subunit 2